MHALCIVHDAPQNPGNAKFNIYGSFVAVLLAVSVAADVKKSKVVIGTLDAAASVDVAVCKVVAVIYF